MERRWHIFSKKTPFLGWSFIFLARLRRIRVVFRDAEHPKFSRSSARMGYVVELLVLQAHLSQYIHGASPHQ